jgi:hypothetical protein
VALSPNEKYAALVAVAGYVPVCLSAGEYIELLPACWRAIGPVGVRISHRSSVRMVARRTVNCGFAVLRPRIAGPD